MKHLFMVGALVIPLVGTAYAGGYDTGRVSKEIDQNTPKLTIRDRKFVEQAASTNLAEIKMGSLALEKSSDPQVKAFAKKMVNDHQKAYDNLRQIADAQNMPMPTAVETKDQAEYDRLSKMEGRQFDQAFSQLMVKGHDQAVSMFTNASNNLDNDQLRNYAATTLPTLKEHQQHAVSNEREVTSPNPNPGALPR